MKKLPAYLRLAAWTALALTLVAGGIYAHKEDQSLSLHIPATGKNLPTLTLYTSPAVTTPQIPFWLAQKNGAFSSLFHLSVNLWKDPESLQSFMLAGKGDLWVGHLEGFGRAKKRGAPVTLLAVTGWKKFYLVSRNPEVTTLADIIGSDLPFTPPGSPAVPLLQAVLGQRAKAITFVPSESKHLALMLASNRSDTALVPEPILTSLLERAPELRIVASVEEAFGKITSGKPRAPLAGIAINTETAKKTPALASALLAAIKQSSEKAQRDKTAAVESLPEAFSEVAPKALILKSLVRDTVAAEAAEDVQPEIENYFKAVAPELVADGRIALDDSFIWREH